MRHDALPVGLLAPGEKAHRIGLLRLPAGTPSRVGDLPCAARVNAHVIELAEAALQSLERRAELFLAAVMAELNRTVGPVLSAGLGGTPPAVGRGW